MSDQKIDQLTPRFKSPPIRKEVSIAPKDIGKSEKDIARQILERKYKVIPDKKVNP